jgi:DNA-binding NarL/FixJ family response regulator
MDTMEKVISVLVVEDHPLFRDALIKTIKRTGFSFGSFGEADTEHGAIELLSTQRWDLVILDLRLKNETSGIVVLKKITRLNPVPPAIVCSSSPHYQDEVKGLGAKGFIDKFASSDEIRDAIRSVLQGGAHFPDIPEENSKDGLTPREIQVLRLIALGHPSKMISKILKIAESTVEFHRGKLMRKTKSQNVADLTRYACLSGHVSDSAQ